jgi:hypothetical protein
MTDTILSSTDALCEHGDGPSPNEKVRKSEKGLDRAEGEIDVVDVGPRGPITHNNNNCIYGG